MMAYGPLFAFLNLDPALLPASLDVTFVVSRPGLLARQPRVSCLASFSFWCCGGCLPPLLVVQFSFCIRLRSIVIRDPLVSLRRVGVCVCGPTYSETLTMDGRLWVFYSCAVALQPLSAVSVSFRARRVAVVQLLHNVPRSLSSAVVGVGWGRC